MKSNLGESHCFIPDTQVKDGVPLNHLEAAGNYIVDKKPNVIIMAGDHWDMPSLSSYEKKGSKYFEGKAYTTDIEAGLLGMETLLKPINGYNRRMKLNKKVGYKPRMVFLHGNHEDRITRAIKENPVLDGALSLEHLKLKKLGWEEHKFLEPVNISGINYAHFFYNPNTGKPYCSKAHTRLQHIGFSFTMGHQQGKDIAERSLGNGKTQRALIAGSFYQHHEDYKGPQANNHWQGCVYKHEVKDGNYCLMELSMSYLLEKWL